MGIIYQSRPYTSCRQEELRLVGVDEESLITSEEGNERLGRIWLVMSWRVGGGEDPVFPKAEFTWTDPAPQAMQHCIDPRIFPWYLSRILKFI